MIMASIAFIEYNVPSKALNKDDKNFVFVNAMEPLILSKMHNFRRGIAKVRHPRKAGDLMSGAATKAVDPLAKRRAKVRLNYQV